MSPVTPETSAALSLLNASAVRERAHRMLAIGLEGKLPSFRVDLDRMDGAIDLVLETTRKGSEGAAENAPLVNMARLASPNPSERPIADPVFGSW